MEITLEQLIEKQREIVSKFQDATVSAARRPDNREVAGALALTIDKLMTLEALNSNRPIGRERNDG